MSLTYIAMTVPPLELFLTLVNGANPDANISLESCDIGNPVVIQEPVPEIVTLQNGDKHTLTRDTEVTIQPLITAGALDRTSFTYERVNLTKLFSLVTPKLHEADILEGVDINEEWLWATVRAKYGVQFNSIDFVSALTAGDTVLIISANVHNLAYTGEIRITLEEGLAKRVKTLLLDGFHLPASVVPPVY